MEVQFINDIFKKIKKKNSRNILDVLQDIYLFEQEFLIAEGIEGQYPGPIAQRIKLNFKRAAKSLI